MTDTDGMERRRRTAPREASEPQVPTADRHVGEALRGVYEQTVREDVPSEMLDLLGKLG